MATTYHILLIEDEPEKWYPFLNFTTPNPEFDSFIVDNVTSLEKGKEYIIMNHPSLDAVLMEYNFPNTSSGDVLTAIPWIRKNYPLLPVFVLCANPASEELGTITSFIKAGAVNYFNISNFQPAYLAAHLCAARETRKVFRQYEVVTSAAEKSLNKPFLHIDEITDSQVSGCFAFSLEAVKKPRSDQEESEFMEYSERWHREFFRMLGILIDEKVSLIIKYICPKVIDVDMLRKVEIYWQFTITAGNLDELNREYEKTIRDVNLYLGIHSLFPDNPYVFSPVTNSNQLKPLIAPHDLHRNLVRRKTVECSRSFRQIGYKSHSTQETPVLLSVFKKPDDWSSINTFCKILVQEDGYSQFDISIQPYNLSIGDKEEASKWASGLPENFPLQEEGITIYKKFLEGLSHASFKHFVVRFYFYTNGSLPSDAIKAALFNTFALEQLENYQHEPQDPLFTDLYPDYSLPMFSRMPLPQKEGIPGIITVPENMLYIPPNINNDGVRIGHKRIHDDWKDIHIRYPDLTQHAYILGQTGTGKSTMLYTMVMDLLNSGKHVSLIDPHGDLYDQVVKDMPASSRANTVFFDPSASSETIPGINFLSHDPSDPFQKSFLMNSMYTILDSLYDMKLTGGPIFIKYFQAAMRLVMESQGSILDIIQVFENKDYRDNLLANTKNPELTAEWNELGSTSGDYGFANISIYITSKLNEFRNNAFLREILGTKENQLDFNDIMNNGKNLLVRLPIGVLGERGVNLVGQIIFNKFLMTAFAREKLKEELRLDHVLVVDEFHKFTTDAIGKVFSEARKYHLSLVVANQTFAQLQYDVQHILLGNVGSMMFFRPGINDAQLVARYFEPDFTAGELCSLPNYHCAARISISQRPSKPFIFETIKIES